MASRDFVVAIIWSRHDHLSLLPLCLDILKTDRAHSGYHNCSRIVTPAHARLPSQVLRPLP